MTTNAELDSSDTRGSYAYIDALKGVEYGPGSVKTALPKFLDLLQGSRAFVVTGRSLYHKVRPRLAMAGAPWPLDSDSDRCRPTW